MANARNKYCFPVPDIIEMSHTRLEERLVSGFASHKKGHEILFLTCQIRDRSRALWFASCDIKHGTGHHTRDRLAGDMHQQLKEFLDTETRLSPACDIRHERGSDFFVV